MGRGRRRFVVSSTLVFSGIYLCVITLWHWLLPRSSESLKDFAESLVISMLAGVAIGAGAAGEQWKELNRLYFERTGDPQAKANADAIHGFGAAPLTAGIALIGFAISAGWWTEAADSRSPLAWVMVSIALVISLGFAILSYRQFRVTFARK